jgi:hypothetical protein
MDQLSRSDEFRDLLDRAEWDLVVIDEARGSSSPMTRAQARQSWRAEKTAMPGPIAACRRSTGATLPYSLLEDCAWGPSSQSLVAVGSVGLYHFTFKA